MRRCSQCLRTLLQEKPMNENMYNEQIVEWSKKGDNPVIPKNVHCRATASNPLCGDRVAVEVEMDGDAIKSVSCRVKGCLLCRAAGAILSERMKNVSPDDLKNACVFLDAALRSADAPPESFPEEYRLFYPVRLHKSRRSCVMLPFETVIRALSDCAASDMVKSG